MAQSATGKPWRLATFVFVRVFLNGKILMRDRVDSFTQTALQLITQHSYPIIHIVLCISNYLIICDTQLNSVCANWILRIVLRDHCVKVWLLARLLLAVGCSQSCNSNSQAIFEFRCPILSIWWSNI
jgi:hypothetical protein